MVDLEQRGNEKASKKREETNRMALAERLDIKKREDGLGLEELEGWDLAWCDGLKSVNRKQTVASTSTSTSTSKYGR